MATNGEPRRRPLFQSQYTNNNNLLSPIAPRFKVPQNTQTYLNPDTRNIGEVTRAREYANNVMSPTIGQEVSEALQLPLRYMAKPFNFIGDLISIFDPNSTIADFLGTTAQDRQADRIIKFDPRTSNRDFNNYRLEQIKNMLPDAAFNLGMQMFGSPYIHDLHKFANIGFMERMFTGIDNAIQTINIPTKDAYEIRDNIIKLKDSLIGLIPPPQRAIDRLSNWDTITKEEKQEALNEAKLFFEQTQQLNR